MNAGRSALSRPPLQPCPPYREEGADRDGDRREPRDDVVRGRRARGPGLRRPRGLANRHRRGRKDRDPGRAPADQARRLAVLRRESNRDAGARARGRARRRDGFTRGARGRNAGRRHRRLLDELARRRAHQGRACRGSCEEGPAAAADRPGGAEDLDPTINDLPDCYLYDIDDLEAVVHETSRGREAEFAKAEAIAVEEARFREWLAARDVAPTIASLRERAEAIRRASSPRRAHVSPACRSGSGAPSTR